MSALHLWSVALHTTPGHTNVAQIDSSFASIKPWGSNFSHDLQQITFVKVPPPKHKKTCKSGWLLPITLFEESNIYNTQYTGTLNITQIDF